MKRVRCILLINICFIIFVACGSDNHTGKVKTPSGSSIMEGKNYQDVIEEFEEQGFTNIKLEKIEDLIIGWLTKDGEVEEVSVGGDFNYSPDEWVKADTEVIIRYHTFEEKEGKEIEQKSEEDTNQKDTDGYNDQDNEEEQEKSDEVLTIDNCEELADILSNKEDSDEAYLSFANKYGGKTIKFDGRIDYLVKHGEYDTRYDILVSAGDYDQNHQIGPNFKFDNVAAYDLALDTMYLEEKIEVGKNVQIIAKVGKFDKDSYLFFLEPIAVTER